MKDCNLVKWASWAPMTVKSLTDILSQPHAVCASSWWGCSCRGVLTPEQAVQRYTGQHWRVPASLLSQMSHFAKYAIAVYGLEPHSHKESRFTNTLMAWLRKSKDKMQRGDLDG